MSLDGSSPSKSLLPFHQTPGSVLGSLSDLLKGQSQDGTGFRRVEEHGMRYTLACARCTLGESGQHRVGGRSNVHCIKEVLRRERRI